jgi:CBS domain-containing protein
MKAGEICNRVVVFATKEMPLAEAAQLMRAHHVGSLVVTADGEHKRIPVGIITDRDIVIAVVAADVDHRTLTVGDITAGELITAGEGDDVLEVLKMMRQRGVRRVPVVTKKGELAGILTLDDLLEVVAEQLDDLVKAISREQSVEAHERR